MPLDKLHFLFGINNLLETDILGIVILCRAMILDKFVVQHRNRFDF